MKVFDKIPQKEYDLLFIDLDHHYAIMGDNEVTFCSEIHELILPKKLDSALGTLKAFDKVGKETHRVAAIDFQRNYTLLKQGDGEYFYTYINEIKFSHDIGL